MADRIELVSSDPTCYRCGISYPKRTGYFQKSYTPLNKGAGYVPICNECLRVLFQSYMNIHHDEKIVTRIICRKLDLYWDDDVFDTVFAKNGRDKLITKYIQCTNKSSLMGKCYDDTLEKEGTLWDVGMKYTNESADKEEYQSDDMIQGLENTESLIHVDIDEDFEATHDIVMFWGEGNTRKNYWELEQRKNYWVKKLKLDEENIDPGEETIIKQICQLEIDINRDRIAGRPVDKLVNTLNTLLGSGNLKPTQKTETDSNNEKTPYGVWIRRFENERPVPEVDQELEDVDGIVRYITVWFLGHLCKMLNIKNSYTRLYEEEIERLRVERPEYEEETDDDMIYDIFSDKTEEE